jgi:hypothetical protein
MPETASSHPNLLAVAWSDAAPIVVRSLAELLAHPEVLQAPKVVIPQLVWTGRVTLAAGREKGGKSTLVAAGCATLTNGGYFLGQYTPCGSVLWLSADNESLYDQVARFRRFGAEPQNLYLVTDWDRTPSALLRVAAGASVVVIDTLASFAELAVADAGSSSAWTPIMMSIKRCANETGAGIILIHHASKGTGTYRDSTAIGAGVDCILEIAESTDAPGVRRIKARARWPLADFSVRLDGDRFELIENVPSLDAQILAAVIANPGISGNAIRKYVPARHEAIVASLNRLAASGAIVNRGSSRRAQWHPAMPDSASVVPVVPDGREQATSESCSRAPIGGARNNDPLDGDQLDAPEQSEGPTDEERHAQRGGA